MNIKFFLSFFVILLCSSFTLGYAADLRITEVSYDGSDERVEIANISQDDFVGSLQLSGVKSSLVTLNDIAIPARSVIIIGDNLSMLSNSDALVVYPSRGLVIPDTQALGAYLLIDGEVVDEFVVSQSQITQYDNTLTAFHKLWNGEGFDVVPVSLDMIYGVITSYKANPGRVYTVDGQIWIGDTQDGGEDGGEDGGNKNDDGDYEGNNDNQRDELIGRCTNFETRVTIDEIYRGDQYDQYIELLWLSDYEGGMTISGTALSTTVDIVSQTRRPHTRYLIARSLSGLLHDHDIIIAPDLQISTGSLLLYDDNGQIIALGWIDNESDIVIGESTEDCVQGFVSTSTPSPGFDQRRLVYMGEIVIVSGSQCDATDSGADETDGGNDNKGGVDDGSSSSGTGSIGSGQNNDSGLSGEIDYTLLEFEIRRVDVGPPGVTSQEVDLYFSGGWDEVILDTFRLRVNGTNRRIYGTVQSGQLITLTGNFGILKTRESCLDIIRGDIVYTTLCHDPTSVSTDPTSPEVGGVDYGALSFRIINVDVGPPGVPLQHVEIDFISGADEVILDTFRLRVNGTNRRIYGTVQQGNRITVSGNFGILKTKESCLEITHTVHTYTNYCLTPVREQIESPVDIANENDREFVISQVDVGAPGESTQSVTLGLVGGGDSVFMDHFRLRVNGTNRRIYGTVSVGQEIVVSGNFGILKTKPTLIELTYNGSMVASLDYVPDGIQAKQEEILNTIDISSHPFKDIQLYWTLPNPKGKDIKGVNEFIALYRAGGSGQKLTDEITLVIGSSRLSLSGYIFLGDELVIAPDRILSNQPACIGLELYGQEIDRLCYPQAKDDTKYYHTRRGRGPELIPDELIQALVDGDGSLSKLILKRVDTKICMIYDGVQIRCMNAPNTKTSDKNRALLTLSNTYIRMITDLAYAGKLEDEEMVVFRRSYTYLRQRINNNQLATFEVYGASIRPTELERYVNLTYRISPEEYIVDVFSRTLLGHDKMDQYYREVYGRENRN